MTRPPTQRWIKRPPRPSRHHAPPRPPHPKPRAMHLVIAIGVGMAVGVLAATAAITLGAREGFPGLLSGIGMFGGALMTWRAFGFDLQDLRNFFSS